MTSYGGLIPGQSEEDFFSCSSMPRNRELMRVFKDVGLVEQLGSGMSRILNAYDRSVFEISDHFIKVAFPILNAKPEHEATNETTNEAANETANEAAKKIAQRKKGLTTETVLSILQQYPSLTMGDLALEMNCSRATVWRLIKQLQLDKRLKRIGPNKGGHWEIMEVKP